MNLGAIDTVRVFVIRVMIATAAMTIAASEMAFAATDDVDYWKQSGMKAESLQSFLTKERCYKDENSFLGCIEAINLLLLNSEEPKILSNKVSAKILNTTETVKTIDGLNIQKITRERPTDNKESINVAWNKAKAERNARNASWKNLYKLTSKKPINIEKIVAEALASTKKVKLEENLSVAFNEYLNNAIDPHTNLRSRAENNAMMKGESNKFSGIGCNIEKVKERIIMDPMPGSPSEKAGVQSMDILTHIDGVAVSSLKRDEVTTKLRGQENTTVNVQVTRKGKIVRIPIVRQVITPPEIAGKIITEANGTTKVGYIKLASFMEDGICKKFVTLAVELRAQGAESLILDVRNNGGGSVGEVLCMAASYLDGNVEMLQFREPFTDTTIQRVPNDPMFVTLTYGVSFYPKFGALYKLYNKKPLVILQNSRSASASELLPGALQSYNRVITVGVKSYGKGTMQGSLPAEDIKQQFDMEPIEGVMFYKTLARFHFASGETNQAVGISADFEVYSTPNPTEEDKFAMREVDSYPNALPAGLPPKGASQATKQKIAACMAARNNIMPEFEAADKAGIIADHQLTAAREVASCL